MDQNLAIECIEVVEKLSQKEKNKILSVLKRDDKLRIGQEQKINLLKQEINAIRKNAILRGGDDQSKMCVRCRAEFGFLFNRGDICPACRFRVCNQCQEFMFNKSWLCKLCYKQRQLKWLTGEWAAFEQNPLRKWASGGDLTGGSLQVFSGATSIDIGEPDRNRTNNNRSSKSAHNGVLGSSDHDKQRVEFPKEADQLKLSQLFGVLRPRKPEEETKELQVRRVSTRKYSETDSDSSSSSDVEAPSVTESELDKTDSPRSVESPKSRLEAVDEDINESAESDRISKSKGVYKGKQKISEDTQQDSVCVQNQETERIVRPKVAPASNKQKTQRAELDSSGSQFQTQPKRRERKKIMPDQNIARELRLKAEESAKVSQSKSVDINLNEPIGNSQLINTRKVSSNAELSSNKLRDPYASRSHESLDKSTDPQTERVRLGKSHENLQTNLKLSKNVSPVIRRSAENLSPEVRSKVNQNVRRSHENLGVGQESTNQNIRQARSHESLPTGKSQYKDEYVGPRKGSSDNLECNVSQKNIQKPVVDIEVTHVNVHEQPVDKEIHGDTGIDDDTDILKGPRAGSPYSFSMDSLPSSNPSPTLRRSIDSSIPESSDNDSVSKLSHQEEFSGTESQVKEGSEDDFVVEEISKVRFQRMSKKAAQVSVLGMITTSPKRPDTCEGVDRGQRKSQSRGGSGGRDTDNDVSDSGFQSKSVAGLSESPYSDDFEPVFEEIICPVITHASKAGFQNFDLKQPDGNGEKMPFQGLIGNKGKTRLIIPSLQLESTNRTRSVVSSTGSEPKSAIDLSWFDEYSADSQPYISNQTGCNRDVRVFVHYQNTKDKVDSDTDSVEGMIDDMARPHLQVGCIKKSARSSEADSEGSFNMTPISPYPPDTFETNIGTYTLTYMSDDNLDAASADDYLDTSEKDNSVQSSIEETAEKRLIPGRSEKQKLKATNSLDLLVAKQGNLLRTDQDIVEIDAEFHEALKIADEHDNGWQSKEDVAKGIKAGETDFTLAPICDLDTKSKLKSEGDSLIQFKKPNHVKEKRYDTVDSSFKVKSLESDKNESMNKVRLASRKSLDLLVLNQGDLIDPATDNVELDTEFKIALEHHSQEDISPDAELEEVLMTSEKLVNSIGRQQKMDMDSLSSHSENVNLKREHALNDGSSLRDVTDGTEIIIPSTAVKQHLQLLKDNASESDESDMLSVIDEEEEYSESLEQAEVRFKLPSTSVHQTDTVNRADEEVVKDSMCGVVENHMKLAEKVKLIEDKVRGATDRFESPGHDKYEGYDVKVHSKFKKLQEKWSAFEMHEADILDAEDEADDLSDNLNAKQDDLHTVYSGEIKKAENNETISVESSVSNKTSLTLEIGRSDILPSLIPSDPASPNEKLETQEIDTVENFTDKSLQDFILHNVNVLNTSVDNIDNFALGESEAHLKEMPGQRTTGLDQGSSEFVSADIIPDNNKIVSKAIDDDDDLVCHSPVNVHFESRFGPIRLSLSDESGICQSLTELDKESKLCVVYGSNTDRKSHEEQDLNTHESLASCQSFEGDLGIQHQGRSIHGHDSCLSIADDETDVLYDLNQCTDKEDILVSHSSDCVFTDETHYALDKSRVESDSRDENETVHRPLVRISKLRKGIKAGVPIVQAGSDGLDRSGTYIIKQKLSDSSSQGEHAYGLQAPGPDTMLKDNNATDQTEAVCVNEVKKAKVEKIVDTKSKEENDNVFPPEPHCFKVPSLPLKLEPRVASSSVQSSPDLSFDLPFTPVDSPRSDKIRTSPQTISESSASQDDSGLVSSGSRGTTPEHKRTDSGYSQSSMLSSLSTVTDRSTEEDEDIDKVLAKMKASGNRGNLLSVVSDSRESIASFYSDAGDFSHSNIPVTGEILFGLNYNYKTGMLEMHIKQCRDIAAVDTKRRRSDPYVKTYLLPDKTRSGKRKTKVKKHTLNPTFDEQLKYSISKSELENRTLWVTVWHNDRFGRNDFLGEVTINFDYYKFDDPSPKWYPLQERLDSQPTSILTYKGDIVLSIRYVPADKVKVTEFKGKSPKRDSGPGKGQLHVLVKEARNLTAVRANGFSDPFCKGYLLPERHRSSKQKTPVIKKNCSPVWIHTFIFEDVSLMELQERSLELTIWDYEKLSSNDFLGGTRLNLGTGLSQGKLVDWMDARGEEMTMWQAMLDRPNVWIDGTLILRPNMEKRRF